MKKTLMIAVVLFAMILAGNALAADDTAVKFEQPVLITSIGQSPDALMAKVLLNRVEVEVTYSPLATVEDIAEHKAIVMAVGVSSKGLGAAGIDFTTELNRTEELLAYANENNIPIILVHVGGKSRRGAKSNQLIELVAGKAAYMIITSDGNEDGFFTDLAEELAIPLKSADKISNTGEYFSEIF